MLISFPLRMTIGSTLWLRHLVLLWRNTGLEIRLHYHRDSSKLFSLKVRNNVFLNRAQWCYRRKENPLFVNTKTTRTSPGDLFPLELIHCWNFVLVPPCMISWISIHDRRAEFYFTLLFLLLQVYIKCNISVSCTGPSAHSLWCQPERPGRLWGHWSRGECSNFAFWRRGARNNGYWPV